MKPVTIANDVYWVGAIDRNLKRFHGYTYTVARGTTYNSYLIMDDKITLVDAVYAPFAKEWIDNIKSIIDPAKIDYIVVNHLEIDHTGSLPELVKLCPKAKLYSTAKCKEGLLKNYDIPSDMVHVVKTGDKLNIGKRNLDFIEVPMIHWPDSMFTYCAEDKILFSNDAFGQHYATSERFDDEVSRDILMAEAIKYYANILWPLAPVILKKLEDVKKLGIKINVLATSHGIIWRKNVSKIIDAYVLWSQNKSKQKVTVIFDSMWGSTEIMAGKIADAIKDSGVDVALFNVNKTSLTEIIAEMFDSKGFIIGSSTHDNDMLPTMAGFLSFLKGLKPKNRIAAAFGSYGWSGGAVVSIEKVYKELGLEIIQPSVSVKHVPDENDKKACYDFGMSFAKLIKSKI